MPMICTALEVDGRVTALLGLKGIGKRIQQDIYMNCSIHVKCRKYNRQ